MLLDLENEGHEVYYSAPAFHTSEKFNEAFLSRKVKAHSFWMKPSKIGSLLDENNHHIAFVPGAPPHFCSKPRPLDMRGDFQEFEESVLHSFKKKSRTAMKREMLEETARHLSEIVGKDRQILSQSESALPMTLEERHPLDQIAYYSQVFRDAQLFVVREQIDVHGAVD